MVKKWLSTVLCLTLVATQITAGGMITVGAQEQDQAAGQAEVIEEAKQNTGPRSFSGENLNKVDIPMGGLGTGCVYFDGNAVVHNWDIGRMEDPYLMKDNSLFAIVAKQKGEQYTKILQGGKEMAQSLFYQQPTNSTRSGGMGKQGQYFIGTTEVGPNFTGWDDTMTGILESDVFVLPEGCTQVTALVGGGRDLYSEYLALVAADGTVIGKLTGDENEMMFPKSLSIPAEYQGKEVYFKIVDLATGGWGHINVDDIQLKDANGQKLAAEGFVNGDFETGDLTGWNIPPTTAPADVYEDVSLKLEYPFAEFTFQDENLPVKAELELSNPMVPLNEADSAIPTNFYNIKLTNTSNEPVEVSVLSTLANGMSGTEKTNVQSQDDNGTYIKLSTDLDDGTQSTGSLCLWTDATGDGVNFSAGAADAGALLNQLKADGKLDGTASADENHPVAGLSVPVTLQPGESRTVSFHWSWYFPHMLGSDIWGSKREDIGRRYANFYDSIDEVVADVSARRTQLLEDTRLYHNTMYDTNLPYYMVDAVTANSVIMRARTMFVTKNGDVYGWEGSDGSHGSGSCNGNCMHVWNYAQTLANLYPELAQRWKTQDFTRNQLENGLLLNRVNHVPSAAGDPGEGPAVDGVLGAIEGAYREHLNSGDMQFLTTLWPNIKTTMDASIEIWDPNHDGVMENAGSWNTTFDGPINGVNSFTGAQYLAALRAAEQMALEMGDSASASLYREIYTYGNDNLSEASFNGEYYIQNGGNQYGVGVLSDQLLGQSHAFLENLGFVLPEKEVRSAMNAVFKYNFFKEVGDRYHAEWDDQGRVYAHADDAALFNCVYPNGGDGTALYLDETWPGFEYEVATTMLYLGEVEKAQAIVYALRDRMDGEGFNPMDERELGGYYARSMASYGVLNAAVGVEKNGPQQTLGFKPNYSPEDMKGFFTYVDGWGSFAQKRTVDGDSVHQENEITVKYGEMNIRNLDLYPQNDSNLEVASVQAQVKVNGQEVACTAERNGDQVRLAMENPLSLQQNDVVTVTLDATMTEKLSADAGLSDLAADGVTVKNFRSSRSDYELLLPADAQTAPVITATAAEEEATVTINQADGLPGTATIQIVAPDGVTTKQYTVRFTVIGQAQTPTGWNAVNGTWAELENGLTGSTSGPDAFILSEQAGDDFIYEADIKLPARTGAAALIFRSGDQPATASYALNIDANGLMKLFSFPYQLLGTYEVNFEEGVDPQCHLKVVVRGSRFEVYLNHGETPIMSTTDDRYQTGRFGMNVWQTSGAEITNIRYTILPPCGVTNPVVLPADGQLTVFWSDPMFGQFDHVNVAVYDDQDQPVGEPITVLPGAQQAVLTGLENGKKYAVKLYTQNAQGICSETLTLTGTPEVRGDALTRLVELCVTLNQADYTAESWGPLQTALVEAKAVLADGQATQKDRDLAYNKLADAYLNLENVELVIKTELNTLLQEARNINTDNCRPQKVTALQEAIRAAEAVAKDDQATQKAVNEAADALLEAIVNLKEIADREALSGLIVILEKLEAEQYTAESYAALQDALKLAKSVEANLDASVAEITDAYHALQDAQAHLERKPVINRAALANAIRKAELILKESDSYMPNSIAGLDQVLEMAKGVYADPNATQEEITLATQTLSKACAKACVKEDREVLLRVIDEAETLNSGDYTVESFALFTQRLEEAKRIAANGDATREEIDQAARQLQAAMRGLVKSGDGNNGNGTSPTGDALPVVSLTLCIVSAGAYMLLKKRKQA